MECIVKLKIPRELLTPEEIQDKQFGKTAEWANGWKLRQCSSEFDSNGRFLVQEFFTGDHACAGQFTQSAYCHFEYEGELPISSDYGSPEWEVSYTAKGRVKSN